MDPGFIKYKITTKQALELDTFKSSSNKFLQKRNRSIS